MLRAVLRTCGLLLTLLLATGAAADDAPAHPFNTLPDARQQAAREEYRAALADLYAVRLSAFDIRLARLQDYPLLPYLHYAKLMRYISAATPADVAEFRTRWADTPLADRALLEWLDNLARRHQWQTFADAWDPSVQPSDELRCNEARALLETGDPDAAFAIAHDMWLVDHSQPDACDPVFDAWVAAGGIDDEIAWQRFDMVLQAGHRALATWLVRFLAPASRTLAEQYLALHRAPQRLARMRHIPGGHGGAREMRVVAHAVQRLARRDVEAAEQQWARWQDRLPFTADVRSAVREDLVRYRARDHSLPAGFVASWPPPDLEPATATDLVEELTRDAIRDQRWGDVLAWLGRLPDWDRQRPGWQYWQARAELARASPGAPLDGLGLQLADASDPTAAEDGPGDLAAADEAETTRARVPGEASLPSDDGAAISRQAPMAARTLTPVERDARRRLEKLATQRNYYGFLAADQIGHPYTLERARLDLTELEVEAVAREPAMQRALELRAIGELPDARREMAWLMDRLDDRQLLAVAEFARRVGWHRQSIQAAIAAEHWDQVDLRFPLAYRGSMLKAADERDLQPSWLYAVARQESAFMTDARSSAGALGVMQIMPRTARLTARRFDIPLGSSWQLLDENKNIRIGSGYLRQMYDRFDRNRILASAAYNAGPSRVDRWLRERSPNPADIWIESIPYRETRNYVQNVLAYSLIYSIQLGQAQPFLYDNEK